MIRAVLTSNLGVLAAVIFAGCTAANGAPAESPATAAATPTPAAPPDSTPSPSPTPTPATPEPTPSPTSTPVPDDWELPDLQTLPPEDFRIQRSSATGQPELRFTSHVVNLGLGPLIMVGNYDRESGKTRAVQRIRIAGGEYAEREIGFFVFHPGHDHWHFEDFNLFELWSYGPGGELLEMLSTSGKHSWCVTETGDPYEPRPDVYDPHPILAGCHPEMQAIATGWVDTYEWHLPGQELDLTGIPDGRYAFRSIVNPDWLVVELDYEHNELVVYIEIREGRVTVLDGP